MVRKMAEWRISDTGEVATFCDARREVEVEIDTQGLDVRVEDEVLGRVPTLVIPIDLLRSLLATSRTSEALNTPSTGDPRSVVRRSMTGSPDCHVDHEVETCHSTDPQANSASELMTELMSHRRQFAAARCPHEGCDVCAATFGPIPHTGHPTVDDAYRAGYAQALRGRADGGVEQHLDRWKEANPRPTQVAPHPDAGLPEVPDDILMRITDLLAKSTKGAWRQCRPCQTNAKGCNLVWAESNPHEPVAGGDEVCMTNVDAKLIALLHSYSGYLVREVQAWRAASDRAEQRTAKAAPLTPCDRDTATGTP